MKKDSRYEKKLKKIKKKIEKKNMKMENYLEESWDGIRELLHDKGLTYTEINDVLKRCDYDLLLDKKIITLEQFEKLCNDPMY